MDIRFQMELIASNRRQNKKCVACGCNFVKYNITTNGVFFDGPFCNKCIVFAMESLNSEGSGNHD